MYQFIAVCCSFVIFIVTATNGLTDEKFNEELVVRPLADSHVNTYFQFSTRWSYNKRDQLHHTNLVPRVIADLLLEYDLRELHVSLTQGLWRYESWGYPTTDAPGGAEAWAWFSGANLTSNDVDSQWSRLMGIFSGIMCVSLNFIDKTNSIAPKYGFRPMFTGSTNNAKHVRYATLPREIVCTENLTPWKKLLPCGSTQGFASLLNSGNVHNTKYHSLGLSLRTLCDDAGMQCTLELTQTANLVYDLKVLDGNRNDFSLRRLFGQGLQGPCALAETSKIYVQRSEEGANFALSPPAPYEITTTRGGYSTVYAVYEQKQNKPGDRLFNVACLEQKTEQPIVRILQPPLVYAHRYILGQGQQSGRIVTEITNTHYTGLPVLVQEVIPWFVATYLHTLRIHIRPAGRAAYGDAQLQTKFLHYIPGKQRTASTHLELGLTVPAKSTVRIAIDCDYMMLKWLEYPPDANNGHNIGSSVISTMLPLGRNYTSIPVEGQLFADAFNATRSAGYHQTLRTEALIVSLPTPDFSMPYNVICLACTVVALAFGPIHSVATKRMLIETDDSIVSGGLIAKVWQKIFKRKKKQTPVLTEADRVPTEHSLSHKTTSAPAADLADT